MGEASPVTVDEYLAQVTSDEARASLLQLRAVIREEIPDAQEVISYGIPAFKLEGPVVWIAAFKNHCSLFAGYTGGQFADELRPYKTSKGTIQFSPASPLPESLVRAIVRARLAEIAATEAKGASELPSGRKT